MKSSKFDSLDQHISSKKDKNGGVDAKFMKLVNKFVSEHSDELKELAKK